MRVISLGVFLTLAIPAFLSAQQITTKDGSTGVTLVKMPYSGARNVAELSVGPDYLEAGDIVGRLKGSGAVIGPVQTVGLDPDEARQYGEWHRLGMANAHLADVVEESIRAGDLPVGLLANCSSLMGMLAGVQHAGPTDEPLRVGLMWIDAHGDFNTPETTLSGMLGGMPVAVSAGMALHNLRNTSSLHTPLPTENIVMVAVRDLDPLEQGLVDDSDIQMVSTADIRELSRNLHAQMERLSAISDLIYVHVDMDVLDPREVAGHPLTVADGPTSKELGAAIAEMFTYPKAVAFGVASTPFGENDPEGLSREAAFRLIEGALEGIQRR